MSKGNIIDLSSRRPQKKNVKGKVSTKGSKAPKAPVVDMTARRNEMLTNERRRVRRTMLGEFIGACVVIPERGLSKVTLYDISVNGIAFDMETVAGRFNTGEEVQVRVYLNQQKYFPFQVQITNVREIFDEAVFRHGANFVKGGINDLALKHFAKFVETVSTSLQTDSGDVMVSGISR